MGAAGRRPPVRQAVDRRAGKSPAAGIATRTIVGAAAVDVARRVGVDAAEDAMAASDEGK